MDNCFTFFCLLTHLVISHIRATVVLSKSRLHKCIIIGDKQLQKSSVACVVGYNDSRAVYIASSESCQPNRDLFGVGTKLKTSIFKKDNQINSTVTTRIWVVSVEWIRTWPSTGLESQ